MTKSSSVPVIRTSDEPERAAQRAVEFASMLGVPVYWVHDNGKFKYPVKPDMSYEMLMHVYENSEIYSDMIFVRWVGDDTVDVTRLMGEIDDRLRSSPAAAKFVNCCDIEGDCLVCCDKETPLPFQFSDGLYCIVCRNDSQKVITRVHDEIAGSLEEVQVVN